AVERRLARARREHREHAFRQLRHRRKPAAAGDRAGAGALEGIVAAGIEHEDPRPRRQRAKRVQQIVQPHALKRNVGLALGIEVHRHQVILAVDLRAVAGIEHQRDRVGAAGADLAGEIGDRLPHLALAEIGGRGDAEAGIAEQFRHAVGVVGGVRQGRY
ncbi:hypothetical protein KXW36_001628, partial [Aspergillus fumigatus]